MSMRLIKLATTAMPISFLCMIFLLVSFNDTAHAQMTMTVKADVVNMRGPIGGNECDELWLLLQKNKNIKTVELQASNGGKAGSGRCTGLLIRRYKFNTIAIGHCVSACSSMWLGGVTRKLSGPKSYVGLHGTYNADEKKELSPRFIKLKDIWVINLAPDVDRTLLQQWLNLPLTKQVMRFYQDRAELCDGRDCTPIAGRNIKNAGLSTE